MQTVVLLPNLPFRVVSEENLALGVDAHLERYWPPVALHEGRVQPFGQLGRVLYGSRESDYLGSGIEGPELDEGDLHRRTPIRIIDQVDLIRTHDGQVLEPSRPVSQERVSLL